MHESVWRSLIAGAQEARGGQAKGFLLRGTVGLGKTTLVNAVAMDLAEQGFLLLRASGYHEEQHTVYAALNQLLWPLRHLVAESQGRAELESSVLGLSTDAGQGSVPVALLTFLSELAETTPVAVLVDDVQWIDQSSREALLFATRRLDADAVLTVLAYRPDELLLSEGGLEALDLAPLSPHEARKVLKAWHPDLSAHVLDEILTTAGGVPLVLREAPLELSAEQRRGTAPLPATLPIGASLNAHFSRRLAKLDDSSCLALTTFALEKLDRDHTLGALKRLGLTEAALNPAIKLGLLRVSESGTQWRHPTVRAAVLETATPAALAAAQAALLEELCDDVAAQARLRNLMATGRDEPAAAALEAAGEEAALRGAFGEAGQMLQQAAHRSPDPAAEVRRHTRAVDLLRRVQPSPALMYSLQALANHAQAPGDRAHWECLLLEVMGYPFSPDPPADILELADRLDPRTACALLRRLSHHAMMRLDFERVVSILKVAYARAVECGRELPMADRVGLDAAACVAGLVPVFGTMGRRDWLRDLGEAEITDLGFPVTFGVTVVGWLGHVEEALAASQLRASVLKSAGMIGELSVALTHEGILHEAFGRLVEARACYERGMSLAEAADLSLILSHGVSQAAALASRMGDPQRAQELLDTLPELVREMTSPVGEVVLVARADLALAQGDLEQAAQLLAAAQAMESAMRIHLPAFSSRFDDQVVVLGLLARYEELADSVSAYREGAAGLPVGPESPMAGAADALLAQGIDEEAWRKAEERAESNPFNQARIKLLRGHQLRLLGRKSQALTHLHAARETLERVGALGLLAIVDRQLKACGERRARGEATASTGWSQLTPREYDVVRLVVEGATNAEAAERLFLSRRTVEYHVGNAMRKLGVTSRAALPDALLH